MNINQNSALGISGGSSMLPSKLSNKSALGGGLGRGSVLGAGTGSVLGLAPSGLSGPSGLGSADISGPQLDPALER